jgi:hypothetical protein
MIISVANCASAPDARDGRHRISLPGWVTSAGGAILGRLRRGSSILNKSWISRLSHFVHLLKVLPAVLVEVIPTESQSKMTSKRRRSQETRKIHF